MENLLTHKCVPCEKGGQKMDVEEIKRMRKKVPGWDVVKKGDIQTLQKCFTFKNFMQALAFANEIGRIAEEQFHHPTLMINWGRVDVTWVTHKIKGLHMNDFAMAAQTDALYNT